jgi:hypothetical protein
MTQAMPNNALERPVKGSSERAAGAWTIIAPAAGWLGPCPAADWMTWQNIE